MERNYNVSGADRKQLVKAIGDALGIRPKYMGTPSFAFRIGSYEVTKHSVLIFEKDEQTANVLAAIEAAGFMAEQSEGDVLTDSSKKDAEEIPQEEGTQITEIEAMAQTTEEHIMEESAPIESQEDIINLSISMPRENFSDTALANLDALLKSKGNLIKAAFDIEEANYTLQRSGLLSHGFTEHSPRKRIAPTLISSASCAIWHDGRSVYLPKKRKWTIQSTHFAASFCDWA